MTTRSLLLRTAGAAAAGTVCILALAAPAAAHVTVNPSDATKGGYTKVAFRVPNETDKADTTKVEINLPADTPIASVSLKPLIGWTAVADKTKLATPIKSDDGEIAEAVTKITWTAAAGSAIKPGQFQEFEISLGPLPNTDQVVFKALQTYSDGNIVRWIDEPTTDGTEAEHPAPVLKLAAGAGDGMHGAAASGPAAQAAPAGDEGDGDGGGNGGTAFGIAGIVLGLAGLAAGLLAYRRATPAAATPAAATPPKTPTA